MILDFSGSDEALGLSTALNSDLVNQSIVPKLVTSASDHGSFGQVSVS